MHRKSDKAKTITIYNEKYYAREHHVMPNVALSIAQEADTIYAVEQGEIEIPSYDHQRRLVCVLRFERIVRSATEEPVSPDAVDHHVADPGTPTPRV